MRSSWVVVLAWSAIPIALSALTGHSTLSFGSDSDLDQYLNAQRNYFHSRLVPGLSKRDHTEVSLTQSANGFLWATEIHVGTPPISYKVAVDTGSADLWLSESVFNGSASSTYRDTYESFSIQYGKGSVAGRQVQDVITLGTLTQPKQTFGIATLVNGTGIADLDGVLGFGVQALSRMKALPFWQNVPLEAPIFGLSLSDTHTPASNLTTPSVLTLGQLDGSLYAEPMQYLDTVDDLAWVIPISGFNISGHVEAFPTSSQALIDSGTPYLAGPMDVVKRIYSHIPRAKEIPSQPGFFKIPCNSSLHVSIAFGKSQFLIQQNDFVVQSIYIPHDQDDDQDDRVTANDLLCLGAIGGMTNANGRWLIGSAFLKNVYTAFDNGQPRRVGFASLSNDKNISTMLPAQISGAHSWHHVAWYGHWVGVVISFLFIFS